MAILLNTKEGNHTMYLIDRANNIDNRPTVATIHGIAVPQYPYKLSEMPLEMAAIDGPTCRPMQNTNKIKPNSRMKCRMCISPVNPKCPSRIPVKRTKH